MVSNALHFWGISAASGSVANGPALNLWRAIILLAIVLIIESIAIVALSAKKKKDSPCKQTRTYVALLPALLLGAAAAPNPNVVICATLCSLAAADAIVIGAMLIKKKKSKNAQDDAAEEPVSQPVEQAESAPETTAEEQAPAAFEPTSEETTQAFEPVEENEPPKEEVQEEPEQPAEEPTEEPAVAVVPIVESEEPEEEGNIDDLTAFIETGEAVGKAFDRRRNMFVFVRYNRSYTSRLIQSDDKTKSFYDEIKGELMSYKGVKSRISWRHENFRIGRERVAKLQFRGKKICLYLPLDPNDYVDSKYKIEDFSDVAKNKEVPLAYIIKNDLRVRYAKDLIADVMTKLGAEKLDKEVETYSQEYPYDTLENLIGRKLIKVLMTDEEYGEIASDIEEDAASATVEEKEQPAQEQVEEQVDEISEPVEETEAEPIEESETEPVEETEASYEEEEAILPDEIVQEVIPETAHVLISDERAAHLIKESSRYADRTRTGCVNIDALSRNFNAGEHVTLEEMKKRISGFDKRMTYVKVLARGTLDKPLIVEGDDFSIDAAKMILLTGGKVLRTKRNK